MSKIQINTWVAGPTVVILSESILDFENHYQMIIMNGPDKFVIHVLNLSYMYKCIETNVNFINKNHQPFRKCDNKKVTKRL
jgi:hypothetical protein